MLQTAKKSFKVALIGNPNVGKSVVFNNLTGIRQHVGNWPGKTVEKKEGRCVIGEIELHVVDLPGTYSLSAHSIDEIIARDFIVEEKPDIVIDVVDASNIERNLYLTLQLLELEVDVVVALNMFDIAENKGYKINVKKLAELLNVPVIPTVATAKKGIEELKKAVIRAAFQKKPVKNIINYGPTVEEAIRIISNSIKKDRELSEKYPTRWLAVKLLENDPEVLKKVKESQYGYEILAEKEKAVKYVLEKEHVEEDDLELLIVDKRYETVGKIIKNVLKRLKEEHITVSDMLDKVFLNKYLGIPIFLALMWGMFQFTFIVAAPFVDLIDLGFSMLSEAVKAAISNPIIASFIADGVIGGLGSVIVFVPNIFFLFLAISLLEDSGYLARAAFVMDRAMSKIGLHGKSFIPMLLGFGCNVPAIMATRSIENEKDRILTILVNPLISCSARLPVYVLIAGAFFGSNGGTVVFAMYVLSIVLAILVATLFRKTLFKGRPSPFIMELPVYRIPTLKSALINMYEKGSHFIKKAGGIILIAAIAIWFLASYPWGVTIENTLIGQIGQAIQPIFLPLGFDWRGAVALIFGFLAKEVVVGTFGVIFGAEDTSSIAAGLRGIMTPTSAFAFMAFTLIYTPCLATLAAAWKETGSKKIVAFLVVYELLLAYVVSLIIVGLGWLLPLI
ncbi:MAG: ferrous iron transport protein B [Candidatus Odinarchaeia archaeon]